MSLMSTNDSYQEIKKITNLNLEGKLSDYQIKGTKDFVYNVITNLIFEPSKGHVSDANHKNFKMEYFYPIFELIINTTLKMYQNETDKNFINKLDSFLNSNNLLLKITNLSKGQNLLYKINHKLAYNSIYEYLNEAAERGTFPIFMFWLNKTKEKKIEELPTKIQDIIFRTSIANSDDRVYKYVLEKIIPVDKLYFQKNSTTIVNMISNLSNSMVPPKYVMKRIKILSQYISLVSYFKDMITSFRTPKIILDLHKFYYVHPHSFETIMTISNYLVSYDQSEQWDDSSLNTTNLKTFYKILKTDEEKIMFTVINSLTNGFFPDTTFDFKKFEKIIVENYACIIEMIDWDNFIDNCDHHEVYRIILKALTNNNLITKLIHESNSYSSDKLLKMMFFTRFCVPNYTIKHIKNYGKKVLAINLLLHKLRLYVRHKTKSKVIEQKTRMFNILKEIQNFAPNNSVPVLKNGSYGYQIQKQKFTNLPPRHLLPGELGIFKQYLIKEKADGILINNLPIGIHPQVSLINNYQVKAEYIEEMDLYLVFDIDIPNTTIIERYNTLRQAHPYTETTKLNNVTNMEEFMNLVEVERNTLKRFLKENQSESIKWYPKFACNYNYTNESMNKQIIEKVILESDESFNQKLCKSEPFNCDGIIITPLNGDREIKIKPKSLMTIDLLFNGKKWVDRNNNDLSNYISKPKSVKKEGKIYRCYPDIQSTEIKFTVGEFRYDKKHPNPSNVIDNIINMIKYDWKNDLEIQSNYYYDNNVKLTSANLINTINAQNNLLSETIGQLEPFVNKNWLDLGCGRGKLINHIKQYNPKYYLGLDIDVKQLVRALKYHDENQNIYNFSPCNLANNWNDTPNKWLTFNSSIKFDYIVANFSIMHFFTDQFWNQLNELTHENTKFMFNIVEPPFNTNEWNESKSYLKVNDEITTYKFEWTHDEEKQESFISSEKILSYLEKYGWKVLDKKSSNSKFELLNFYSWWIITK